MSSLLHDLGVWCFRRAKTVVALWLVLLALLGVGVAALDGEYDDFFTIPGAPSQVAYDKLQVAFPQASALSANVVVTVPDGTNISSKLIRSRIEKGWTSSKTSPSSPGRHHRGTSTLPGWSTRTTPRPSSR